MPDIADVFSTLINQLHSWCAV